MTEVLQYLLPHVPSSLLMAVNDNKSPPLHWAILNNQVECTKLLAQLPEEQGGGLPMLEVRLQPRIIESPVSS
jgi:ankyrin repeat protein